MEKLPVVSVSTAFNWNCFCQQSLLLPSAKMLSFFNMGESSLFFHCSTACLPRCFAYTVFLSIFSLFMFPINSSRTCSFGTGFQSALLFLSAPANPAVIFFFQSVILPHAISWVFFPFLPLPPPSMRNSAGAQSTGVVCAVSLLLLLFCFLHYFLLISSWKRNNKQRGSQGRRQYGHTYRNRKAKVLSDGW